MCLFVGQWVRSVTTDPVNVKVDEDRFKPGYSDIPQLERSAFVLILISLW